MGLSTLITWALVIAAAYAAARALGLTHAEIADATAARRIATEQLDGFSAGEVFLSGDGQAALVCGGNRDYALIKRRGPRFAVRRLTPPLRVERDGADCWIDGGDPSFGPVRIKLTPLTADRLLTLM